METSGIWGPGSGLRLTKHGCYRTPCTPDYGDCGCDNCQGEFEDISNRMDEFAERLFDLGWDRTKAVWTVPQAFGDDTLVPQLASLSFQETDMVSSLCLTEIQVLDKGADGKGMGSAEYPWGEPWRTWYCTMARSHHAGYQGIRFGVGQGYADFERIHSEP